MGVEGADVEMMVAGSVAGGEGGVDGYCRQS